MIGGLRYGRYCPEARARELLYGKIRVGLVCEHRLQRGENPRPVELLHAVEAAIDERRLEIYQLQRLQNEIRRGR